ncbi:MAG: DUF1294 domain-containing protein [Clostridia bacterium]|nr:DUF1294 domain-containing protein [Clostridia bacterium]
MTIATMIENLTPFSIPYAILGAWLVVISLISIVVCIYDKAISKKGKVELRVPEKVLFYILPLLGGALAMFATMTLIRHKTQHGQRWLTFGIAVLQIAAIVGVTAVIALGII